MDSTYICVQSSVNASEGFVLHFLSLDDFSDKTTNTVEKQSRECCLRLWCTELLVRDKHMFCGTCQKRCANIISMRRWMEACALANSGGPNPLIKNYRWIIKNKHRVVNIICMQTKDTLFYIVAKKKTQHIQSKRKFIELKWKIFFISGPGSIVLSLFIITNHTILTCDKQLLLLKLNGKANQVNLIYSPTYSQ